MMKKVMTAMMALMTVFGLTACGNGGSTTSPAVTDSTPGVTTPAGTTSPAAANEVTYSAKSEADEKGSSAELSVTWAGDTITKVDWKEYSNGTLKDENYGKDFGEEQFKKAQDALKGSQTYHQSGRRFGRNQQL